MLINFEINFNKTFSNVILDYIIEEYSFDMSPSCQYINYSLIINYIDLAVDLNNNIVRLSGFAPTVLNSPSIDISVPNYNKGVLSSKNRLKSGLSYRINDDEWLVHRNYATGWVCIGDYKESEVAIEFLNNCVAIIKNGRLKAIWLKPRFISL